MCPRRWLLSGLLLLAVTLRSAAADDGSAELAQDARLVCQARRALSRDTVLEPLNLGISIRAGNVVVWGFVPSTTAGRRAVETLRKLPGVLQVRSELQVVAPEDFLEQCLNGRAVSVATPVPTLPAPLAAPALLTSRWADWNSLLNATPLPVENPTGVLLMPPLTAPTTATAADTGANLAERVEKVCRSDRRFSDVRAEVRGGIVHLRGQVARPEEGMELAQLIARLPGVERVQLQDVRSGPRP